MARKIVQIAAASVGDGLAAVIAVAGDGTVWKMVVNPSDSQSRPWKQLADLPQVGEPSDDKPLTLA